MKATTSLRILTVLTVLFTFTFFTTCKKDNGNDPQDYSAHIKAFTYLTENFPPFNFMVEGVIYGASVDVLMALFIKMGLNPDEMVMELTEWDVAYDQTLYQKNTMLFSMVRIPAREILFKWVGPIAPLKNCIISLKSNHVVINSSTDLQNYTIGVVTGYADIDILLGEGVPAANLVESPDVPAMYDNLIDGIVDCIAYTEISHPLIVSSFGYDSTLFEIPYVTKVAQLYYAFNTSTPDNLINYFQANLDQLKLDKASDGSSVYEKILSLYNVIQHIQDNITPQMVIDLVNTTSADIAADAPGTFAKINQEEAPYKDPENPALYTFVYDTAVTIVAHATNPSLVGVNFKGKTDAAGKPFRDEIVQGALDHGTGWVDYIYTKPDQSGLYYKTTYYKLTTGSDGKLYVVCAGRYK